ncbi:MAG: ATP-binding cassette domain-containing protein [Eggerthellaceae bacterium]
MLPTSGEIALLGEHQKPGCTSRRMGALIEEPGVLRSLTGLENVACRAMSLGVVDAERVAAETLQEVGLADAAHKRVKSYSLGMKQRLGLALALVGSPDLLLLGGLQRADPQGASVRDLMVRRATGDGSHQLARARPA